MVTRRDEVEMRATPLALFGPSPQPTGPKNLAVPYLRHRISSKLGFFMRGWHAASRASGGAGRSTVLYIIKRVRWRSILHRLQSPGFAVQTAVPEIEILSSSYTTFLFGRDRGGRPHLWK